MSPYSSYHVSWTGHRDNLQAACERHFLDESLVDVTLAVGAGLVKCHRVVLSAASAYFRQLLAQHPAAACPHPIIFMRDMDHWEVMALVDFMYRGEVSVEESRLEQLMRAAETLQIHGLSSCLRACIARSNNAASYHQQSSVDEPPPPPPPPPHCREREADVDEVAPAPAAEADDELTALSRLCELNGELELRPISPSPPPAQRRPQTPHPATHDKNDVKEIEVVGKDSEFTEIKIEPDLIQEDYTEKAYSEEKAEHSDDFTEAEQEDKPVVGDSKPNQHLRQYPFIQPKQDIMTGRPHHLLHDTNLYKRYSPRVLEQALRDLRSGRFQSIRACARYHGIPMTTLRYRAKILPKRSHQDQH